MSVTAFKTPRMTQMSWAETRDRFEAHEKALGQLYGNCDALKTAIDGVVVDGILTSPMQTFLALSFWGRLKWLVTGRLT
jgi:hypothetical protein